MKNFLVAVVILILSPLSSVAQELYGVLNNSGRMDLYYDNNRQSQSVRGDVKRVFENGGWRNQDYRGGIKEIWVNVSVKNWHPKGSLQYMFSHLNNLTTVHGMQNFDFSNVDDVSSMFQECSSLKELDMSGLDMGNVTNMRYMFDDCCNLTSLNMTFSVAAKKVSDMNHMFRDCWGLKSIDLSMIALDNVTNMSFMFSECHSLKEIDFTGQKAGKCTTMERMFARCFSLNSVKMPDMEVPNVTDFFYMFDECQALETIDISLFNVRKDARISAMFAACYGLTTIYCNYDWCDNSANSEIFISCNALKKKYNISSVGKEYAHPNVPGRPGYFTATEGLFFDGRVVTSENLKRYVMSGTVSYDSDENVITMANCHLKGESGFYSPSVSELTIKFKGGNVIEATGENGDAISTCSDIYPVSMQNGSVLKLKGEGYGLHLYGSNLDDEFSSEYSSTIDIYGKLGAIRGEDYLSKKGNYLYPELYLFEEAPTTLTLSSDGEHPVVSGLSKMGINYVKYSYDTYYFNKSKGAVYDSEICPNGTIPNEGVAVTKPFSIVPKDMLQGYGVYLGAQEINNYNCQDFSPMSLKSGKVSYTHSTHTLTLENANFSTPYLSTDDNYALQAEADNFTLLLKGSNTLTGKMTDDGYEYGIWFKEPTRGSNRRKWTIQGINGGSLELLGTLYFESVEADADLLIKDADIKVSDKAYFWQQDNVYMTIDNSSLDLLDIAYPDMTIMEYLCDLTLKGCKFENGCYYNSARGNVNDVAGRPASTRVRITRGAPDGKRGDVTGEGDVNTADAVAIYNYIIRGEISGFTKSKTDIDGNGAVNTADVVELYNIIIKGN